METENPAFNPTREETKPSATMSTICESNPAIASQLFVTTTPARSINRSPSPQHLTLPPTPTPENTATTHSMPSLPCKTRTSSRHTDYAASHAPSMVSMGNLSLSSTDLKKAKLKSISTDNFLKLPTSSPQRRSASGLVSSAKSGGGGGGGGGREVSVCGDDDFDPTLGATPFSPFYIHPMTVTSLEQLRGERQRWSQGTRSSDSNHIDIEAGFGCKPRSNLAGHKEWPSGRMSSDSERWEFAKLKQKKGLLASFTRNQKLLIKVIIAILLVCAMLGIGLGLSVAVNGSVWTAPNQSKTLKIGSRDPGT